MLCELSPLYQPAEYRVKEVTLPWEAERARRLRRQVFCTEQGIFDGDDADHLDPHARLLVALACVAGMPDQVVGTVRIHEEEPGTWFGSRLAVDAGFRRQSHLGATLIRLAVSTAHEQGCRTFLAHVQSQNVPLFERMHWQALRAMHLLGRPHHLMQADLAQYPPCADPASGYVTRASTRN